MTANCVNFSHVTVTETARHHSLSWKVATRLATNDDFCQISEASKIKSKTCALCLSCCSSTLLAQAEPYYDIMVIPE